MSGIFGIIHRDGRPVERADLERMRATMAHRGPDGSDIWIDGSAGFGQLMLCSTPESLHEKLPWQDPESGLVITADARIDNREELAQALRPQLSRLNPPLQLNAGVGAASAAMGSDSGTLIAIPDSLYILEAYKRWGETCVNHLLGDFAFAIWNPRSRQLFCARDPMGVRPFYYFLDQKQLVFASSALAVVSAGGVPKVISEQRIADYLVPGMEGADKTSTWFERVWRMPPAHFANLKGNSWEASEYWRPNPEYRLDLSSDDDYVQAFKVVLTGSVQARMRCQMPVASMLSGGVDSSTIVGLARNLQESAGGASFATYSGVSDPGGDCRESRYSGLVIAQGGLDAKFIRPSDAAKATSKLTALDNWIEDPFDRFWIHHQLLYLSACANGHSVVMDGIDADGVAALTAGYPAFLLRKGHLITANREIRGMWDHYHRRTVSLAGRYWDMLRAGLIPNFARNSFRGLFRRGNPCVEPYCFASAQLLERTGINDRLKQVERDCDLISCKTLRAAHAKRLKVPYLAAGIERYGRLAAVCGIEARHPYLDRNVVEFCLALPWNMKARNGWSKYGLRKVSEMVLPRRVAWRTGWDSVLWKFLEAWAEISMREPTSPQGIDPQKLSDFVDYEKFNNCRNQVMMLGLEAKLSSLSLEYLVKWMDKLQPTAK